MRTRITWTLLTAAFLAAGCTTPAEDGFELDTFTLTTTGMPDSVDVSEPFEFELVAVGEQDAMSTHIGAHYWAEAQDDPTAALGDGKACAHHEEEQDVPGTYTVTCTISEVGTWHVYGHVRIVDDGENHEYWADGEDVRVELTDLV